jgi:hypothetical protein
MGGLRQVVLGFGRRAMDEIRRQVRRAQWRLNLSVFGRALLWSTLASMAVAVVAIAARKLWWFNLDPQVWTWGWLAAGFAAGLVAAGVITWWRRLDPISAAIEIDRRFALKERVTSALLLHDDQRDGAAGQALMQDTMRRIERLDLREAFRLGANRWAWLPLAVILAGFGVAFLPNPDAPRSSAAKASTVANQQRIQESAAALQKKLAERRQMAKEQGMKEADKLLLELERGVNQLKRPENTDRKQAMVQLNDLAKKLEERREALGGDDAIRKRLQQLEDMKAGPAEKLANAMQKGDFTSAAKAIEQLQEKLKSGELSAEDQKKLAEQLQQMQQQLQEMKAMQDEMKKNLQEQIQKQQQAGNLAEASRLQKQLDKLMQQDPQMQKLQEMANQLGQASAAMQKGDASAAQQSLSQLASELQSMEQDLQELEMLADALTQIDGAKSSMNCAQCNGAGCSACQGNMLGMGMGQLGSTRPGGMGMGEGRGRGDRPEEQTDTGAYNSQVNAQPRGGRAVATGTLAGPNVSGDVRQDIKEAVSSARSSGADPLEGVHLPPEQREITRQYFDRFREGAN